MERFVERLFTLAKQDSFEHFCWLDGGMDSGGWFGIKSDLEVQMDSLDGLLEIESLWAQNPERIWMGWISYDLGAGACMGRSVRSSELPGMVMRRYAAVVRIVAGRPIQWMGCPQEIAELQALLERTEPQILQSNCWPLAPIKAQLDPKRYCHRIVRAKELISSGDTYQVNLSQKFEAKWRSSFDSETVAGRVSTLYQLLRQRATASMGALIRATGDYWIVSNSPETLIEVVRGGAGLRVDQARTWPIKGTRPRSNDPQKDSRLRDELLKSEKDRAEHVMIVDLARNDLAKLARPHSVQAPLSPKLMSLPTIYHLCSEVSCSLDEDWRLSELFSAIFPGGSITGAPKRRSVEIIDEIEGEARGVYCGAILVLHPEGLRASIPIRTGIASLSGLSIRSGGGIVADSDPDAELAETWTKMTAFSCLQDQKTICS